MIVVDTSVWIDLFNDVDTPQVSELEGLVKSDHEIALSGPILTEVLRGCVSELQADQIGDELHHFTILEPGSTVEYLKAAGLFRHARSKGITVEGLGDLLVASACISNEAFLLHNDRDFNNLASVTDLKIWKPS